MWAKTQGVVMNAILMKNSFSLLPPLPLICLFFLSLLFLLCLPSLFYNTGRPWGWDSSLVIYALSPQMYFQCLECCLIKHLTAKCIKQFSYTWMIKRTLRSLLWKSLLPFCQYSTFSDFWAQVKPHWVKESRQWLRSLVCRWDKEPLPKVKWIQNEYVR